MPKPSTPKAPKLCFHKGKNLFFVRLNGEALYLGRDEDEAKRRYRIAVAKWWNRGGLPEPPPPQQITVAQVFDRWTVHAQEYYQNNPGHFESIKATYRAFLDVYKSMPAADFGPLALKSYRTGLCDGETSRTTVNMKVNAIRRVFKWAVSEELIPPSVFEALATVEGLRQGRAHGVKEPTPVTDVRWEHVEACLPFMPSPVGDLVRLLWNCGARVGEVVNLTARDIDTSGPVWTATITAHKTAYKGRERILCFGKNCQSILKPRMMSAPIGRPLFSPLESIAERADSAPTHRREGQPETPRKSDRRINAAYDVHAVNRAVARSIAKCNARREEQRLAPIPHWHLHQLRHSFATRTRNTLGLEAASAALGHSDLEVTKIYA
ncbi:MAG: site-specific integrase, partial [Candidatus Hydrogenedens sp.]|nr:site-specific integrase [Candidatus Hydrogenedens sp.]